MNNDVLVIVCAVLAVLSAAVDSVRSRRGAARTLVDVVAELAFFVAGWQLAVAAGNALGVSLVVVYAVLALAAGGVVSYRRLAGTPRAWYEGVLTLVAMTAAVGFVGLVDGSQGALLPSVLLLVAVVALAGLFVRQYLKVDYGTVDVVLGLAYMSCAVKFCQLVLGSSLWAAVGWGMAGIAVAFAVYVAVLFAKA